MGAWANFEKEAHHNIHDFSCKNHNWDECLWNFFTYRKWIKAKFPEFKLYGWKIHQFRRPHFHQGPWAAALELIWLWHQSIIKSLKMDYISHFRASKTEWPITFNTRNHKQFEKRNSHLTQFPILVSHNLVHESYPHERNVDSVCQATSSIPAPRFRLCPNSKVGIPVFRSRRWRLGTPQSPADPMTT